LVPAHMRHLELGICRRYRSDLAAQPAEARGDGELTTALGHELHADADAEERSAPPAHRLVERFLHARYRGEAAPAIGESADAGQHDALGGAHILGVVRHLDRRRDAGIPSRPLERLGGRAQIAGAVIDDDRGRDRAHHMPPPSVPFVEGTSPARLISISIAWRNARARPLKQDSTMWWLFSP